VGIERKMAEFENSSTRVLCLRGKGSEFRNEGRDGKTTLETQNTKLAYFSKVLRVGLSCHWTHRGLEACL
jgi:hypothetical protein